MPKEVHDLAEKLKKHKGVHDSWALAHYIIAHREKAKAARTRHRKKMEEKERGE